VSSVRRKYKGENMQEFRTIADLSKESGLSQMKVRNILKDVTPEIKVGRSEGYHPDALRSALINKLGPELRYLNVQDYASNILAGFSPKD